MNKLLRANFSRLKTEKIFWFSIGFSVLYALAIYWINVGCDQFNQGKILDFNIIVNCYGLLFYWAIPGIVMASFCSLYIGTEFSDGTIRNKLVVGHTRTEIYLANFLTCAVTGIFFSLVSIAILCAIGIPLFGLPRESARMLCLLIIAGTMILLFYAALLNMLSMLLGNKASAAIASLITVIAVLFLCTYLIGKINKPPFIYIIGEAGGGIAISGEGSGSLSIPLYAAGLTATANAAGILLFRKKDLK